MTYIYHTESLAALRRSFVSPLISPTLFLFKTGLIFKDLFLYANPQEAEEGGSL